MTKIFQNVPIVQFIPYDRIDHTCFCWWKRWRFPVEFQMFIPFRYTDQPAKKEKNFKTKKWIPGICLCFLIVIVIWDHGIKIRLHHNRIHRIQVFFLDLNVYWCNWCSTYLYRKCKIINHSVIVPFVKHEPTCTYEFHSCLCLILEKKILYI